MCVQKKTNVNKTEDRNSRSDTMVTYKVYTELNQILATHLEEEVNQNEKTISFTRHFLEDVSRHLFSYPFRFSNFSILVDISKELQRLPNLIKESLRDLVLRTVNFPTTHIADLVFCPKEVFVG